MFYSIEHLCPAMENGRHMMSGCGFSIVLWPSYKEMVSRSNLSQEKIDSLLDTSGRDWLKATGFEKICQLDSERELLGPFVDLRVAWGEWGPEHISVPGNACGLDIDHCSLYSGRYGASLQPHNVDSISQAFLLLLVFTEITSHMILFDKVQDDSRTKS